MEGLGWRRFCVLMFMVAVIMMPPYAGAQDLADQDISDAVEDKISDDRVVPVNQLNIRTAHGIVTLSGKVNEKDRAAKSAFEAGAYLLINEINVK